VLKTCMDSLCILKRLLMLQLIWIS
jgi:hypothetical protein